MNFYFYIFCLKITNLSDDHRSLLWSYDFDAAAVVADDAAVAAALVPVALVVVVQLELVAAVEPQPQPVSS